MNKIKNIFLFCFFLLLVEVLSGCGLINEEGLEPGNGELARGKAVLFLRINKISDSSRNAYSSDGEEAEATPPIKEIINTIRIIIINSGNNIIEANELITAADFNGTSPEFIHVFRKEILAGQKNIYILANEESVTDISFQGMEEDKDLAAVLDSYKEVTGNGAALISFLNSCLFSPSYLITDNTIALPYSCYYSLNLVEGKEYDTPMYLVPDATKYSVSISNTRKDDVVIKQLYINSIADKNYLLPSVGKDNFYMEGLYWIDWLAQVARESENHQEFEDNENFNMTNGWITDYILPAGTSHTPYDILQGEEITIDAQSNPNVGEEPVPGFKSLTSFYLPESQNISSDLSKQNSQSYSIKMVVQAKNSNEEVTLTRTLSNVKSLFRNTHLNLKISFSEGYMHVYGEPVRWTVFPVVNGYLTQENEE